MAAGPDGERVATPDGTWFADGPVGRPADAPSTRVRASAAEVVEQADVVTAAPERATGLVGRSFGPAIVEFSVVGGRAIYEGDIDLGESDALVAALDQAPAAAAPGQDVLYAAVVADDDKLWPGGRVPVELPPEQSAISAVVRQAVAELGARTHLDLVPSSAGDTDVVAFEIAGFCTSQVGRSGGRQVVQVSTNATAGNVLHELCHVVGLWHEQSRTDRDQHIQIFWDEIAPGFEHNFRQHLNDGRDVGAYDFGSIMHYPATAFGLDGAQTIRPLVDGVTIGQRTALSDLDVDAIDALYPAVAPPDPGKPDPPTERQHVVTVPAQGSVTVFSGGWHPRRRVHWDVVPTTGPVEVGLLDWQLTVGRDDDVTLRYLFTITNLVATDVTAEVRYVILEEADA